MPAIVLQFLSYFWTNSSVGMGVREEILKLLTTSSAKLFDVYFVDQSQYLEDYLKPPQLELKEDAKYFWIFRNLDYEKWVQRRDEAKMLGLRGPSVGDLELAASHIVRNLDSASHEGEVLLYFFCGSTRQKPNLQAVVGRHDLVCVWNLLRQLIGNRPAAAGSSLQNFLERALSLLSENDRVQLRAHSNPTDVFISLLDLSSPRDLWVALGEALGGPEEQKNSGAQNLTLIIDLNLMARTWEGLVENIRHMTAGLMKDYGTVRVLLSNVPETSLGQQPSEILLEYDKEREGMYGPQIQSCLRHWDFATGTE